MPNTDHTSKRRWAVVGHTGIVAVFPMVLVAAAFAYAGFQATIRLVVYPQLSDTPPAAFVALERSHQQRVTYVVGPLFGFFGFASVAAVIARPGAWTGLAAACFVAILGTTALAAVPQHRALGNGFDAAAMRRLLMIDSARVVLALVACGAAIVAAVGQ